MVHHRDALASPCHARASRKSSILNVWHLSSFVFFHLFSSSSFLSSLFSPSSLSSSFFLRFFSLFFSCVGSCIEEGSEGVEAECQDTRSQGRKTSASKKQTKKKDQGNTSTTQTSCWERNQQRKTEETRVKN